jgi:hypothetical protein
LNHLPRRELATVKDDGTFTLDNVSPDRYSLRVFNNPDGTYLKAARMGDLDLLANGLDLTSGVSEGMIELTLSSAAGAIDGTVQNDQQQPAAGALDADSGPCQSQAGRSL